MKYFEERKKDGARNLLTRLDDHAFAHDRRVAVAGGGSLEHLAGTLAAQRGGGRRLLHVRGIQLLGVLEGRHADLLQQARTPAQLLLAQVFLHVLDGRFEVGLHNVCQNLLDPEHRSWYPS